MKTFLFEQYGYNSKTLKDNGFVLDNYIFKLIKVDLEENIINEMERYIEEIKIEFNNIGPFIIKNKYNKYISYLLEDKYILVCVYNSKISLQDLYRLYMKFYKDDEYLELDKLLDISKNRVETIEKNLASYLKMSDINYKENLNKSMFCIGLAINSMQYLSDIIYDYGNKLYGVSIVHKRLSALDSFDFFNPLNFIVGNVSKDIALLYQKDLITIQELEMLVKQYNFDVKGISFLLSRIMYRCDIFDYLENKKEIEHSSEHIDLNVEKEIIKIKKAYSLFKKYFNIRTIEWLED